MRALVCNSEFRSVVPTTIKQSIVAGQGVSILPRPTVKNEIDLGVLVGIQIGIPDLVRPLGIIHARHRPLTATVERFIEVVKGNKRAASPRRPRNRRNPSAN